MENVNPAQPHPRRDHERTDIRIRLVLIFAAGMVIIALFIQLAVSWGFTYLEQHKPVGRPISPLAPPREYAPPPRLQVTPRADLQQLEAKEHVLLHEYGWVDRQNNVVRIPIDRAMDLIAQRGLPAQKAAPKAPAKSGGPNAPAAR